MKKLLAIFNLVMVVFAIWFLASFLEVNQKNKLPNPKYYQYNMFVIINDIF